MIGPGEVWTSLFQGFVFCLELEAAQERRDAAQDRDRCEIADGLLWALSFACFA